MNRGPSAEGLLTPRVRTTLGVSEVPGVAMEVRGVDSSQRGLVTVVSHE